MFLYQTGFTPVKYGGSFNGSEFNGFFVSAFLPRPPRLKPRNAGRARDGGQVERQKNILIIL